MLRNCLTVWLCTFILWLGLFPAKRLSPLASAQEAAQMGNLTDKFGNRADEDSNLYFVKYNGTAQYKTPDDPKLLDGGMLPFYNMARRIAQSTFGSEYPYNMVIALRKLDFITVLVETSDTFKFCVALAVFVLVFLLVMLLTLPCCLCCSPCCTRTNRMPPSVLRVTIMGVIVFGLAVVASVGLAGAFITSEHTTSAVTSMFDVMEKAVKDARTFISYSSNETLFMFDKAEFTKTVFFRDLDNIGDLMGRHIQRVVLNESGLGEAVNDVRQVESIVNQSNEALNSLDEKLDQLLSNMSALKTLLNNIANSGSCSSCPPVPQLNFQKPDLTTANATLKQLMNQSLSQAVDQGINNVTALPSSTLNSARDQIRNLKSSLNGQLAQLNKFKDAITNVRDKILSSVTEKLYKDQLQEVSDGFNMYDRVRTQIMEALLAPMLIAVLLVGLGALSLVLVYRERAHYFMTGNEPNTGCTTRTAGRAIYMGAVIFVLFAWIWILFALILFLIGAPMDSIVCAVVQDTNFEIVDTLVEEKDLLGAHKNGTWMVSTFLPIPQSTTTLGSLLRDCRADKSILKAVQIEKHPLVNFSYVIEFLDKINITSQISKIDVPMQDSNLLSTIVGNYLNQTADLDTLIPFDELRKINSTVQRMQDQALAYRNLIPVSQQNYRNQVDSRLKNIDELKTGIQKDVDRLSSTLNNIRTRIVNIREKAKQADREVPSKTKRAIPLAAQAFDGRVSRIVRTFINESKKNVFEDFARCRPVYNIFHAVFHAGVCGNLANMLNGGWLALYWLTILMMAAIFVGIALNRLIPMRLSATGPPPSILSVPNTPASTPIPGHQEPTECVPMSIKGSVSSLFGIIKHRGVNTSGSLEHAAQEGNDSTDEDEYAAVGVGSYYGRSESIHDHFIHQ